MADFSLRQRSAPLRGIVCSFCLEGFYIETFCSKEPVAEQNGFRNFRQMQRIIRLGGEPARRRIVAYRHKGLKTEPAIAAALGLQGDPYQAVLELEVENDKKLVERIKRF